MNIILGSNEMHIQESNNYASLDMLTGLWLRIHFFWDITLGTGRSTTDVSKEKGSLTSGKQGRDWNRKYIYYSGPALPFSSYLQILEDEGSTFLRKVGKRLPSEAATFS